VINLRCNRRPCRACIAILDLEELVDLTQAEFSELKMIAIQELAMGSNSKLNSSSTPARGVRSAAMGRPTPIGLSSELGGHARPIRGRGDPR
jgi:hypothetical protein